MLKYFLILISYIFIFVSLSLAQEQTSDEFVPEGTVQLNQSKQNKFLKSDNWMIVTANPLASNAGAKILRKGGTAADAMIAAQAVLGLVEPQSSGLGGGAFLVWFDGEKKKITTLDARETAPSSVSSNLFLDDDGEPMKFFQAVVGGISVGVPGIPALLEAAHAKWGVEKWEELFFDAVRLAEDGFEISPRLGKLIENDQKRLTRFNLTSQYFKPSGQLKKAGDILKNPNYGLTLKKISTDGIGSFYNGQLGLEIVKTVQNASNNPGLLSTFDLRNYSVKERSAICATYRGYDVCGMGPPSSGALSTNIILGTLENFDLRNMGPYSPDAWRLIGDASRLAFADRARYMADSDFVFVPVKGLLSKEYLAKRGKLLMTDKALIDVRPGNPSKNLANIYADDESIELPSTSHISIIDSHGNALAMTTTIENAFGSRLMTPGGFLLNNELTDFSFRTEKNGIPIANRVEPGKRPRSSMSPTIVLKDNKPILVIGSTGGSAIIGFVVQSIIAYIDWDMNIKEAIDFPHLINRFGTFDIEDDPQLDVLANQLKDIGFIVNRRAMNSGTHAIALGETGLFGAADNRREGSVVGE